jgi:urease accessory protein
MIDKLLPLLQLCDSNFPSGAFSHSFGMETYIQEGVITDVHSFQKMLEIYIGHQLVYTEGLGCRLAYEYLKGNLPAQVWELDEQLFALGLARESREGTKRVGEQMTRLCAALYSSSMLAAYEQRIREKKNVGHPAIVFAMICHHLEIGMQEAILFHEFKRRNGIKRSGRLD